MSSCIALASRGAVLSCQKECTDKCSSCLVCTGLWQSGRQEGDTLLPLNWGEKGQPVGGGMWARLPCHHGVLHPNQTSTSPVAEGSCLCRWQSYSAWTISWHKYSVNHLFVFADGNYLLCALRSSSPYSIGMYLNMIYCLNWSFACTNDI